MKKSMKIKNNALTIEETFLSKYLEDIIKTIDFEFAFSKIENITEDFKVYEFNYFGSHQIFDCYGIYSDGLNFYFERGYDSVILELDAEFVKTLSVESLIFILDRHYDCCNLYLGHKDE